jgi:hypothetical protein
LGAGEETVSSRWPEKEFQRIYQLQVCSSLANLEPEAVGPTSKQLLALAYLMFMHASGSDFARISAQNFNEGPWLDLVEAKLAHYKFIAWARPQCSLQVTLDGTEVVVNNLTKTCHAAASTDLLPLASFLVKQMSQEELPPFLAHELRCLREAATERLSELAQG